MANNRTLPVSYNEKTFGRAGYGRDYTSLSSWESDTDINLVSATKGEVLTCYNDGNLEYNLPVRSVYSDPHEHLFTGATTNEYYFRVLRAAEGHEGTPTSGVRFVKTCTNSSFSTDGGDLYTFIIRENYFQIQYIAASARNQYNNAVAINLGSSSRQNITAIGCVVYSSYGQGDSYSGSTWGFYVTGEKSICINCVSINNITRDLTNSGGFVLKATDVPGLHSYFYNCISINNAIGFAQNYDSIYSGNSTDFTGHYTNCISYMCHRGILKSYVWGGDTETLSGTIIKNNCLEDNIHSIGFQNNNYSTGGNNYYLLGSFINGHERESWVTASSNPSNAKYAFSYYTTSYWYNYSSTNPVNVDGSCYLQFDLQEQYPVNKIRIASYYAINYVPKTIRIKGSNNSDFSTSTTLWQGDIFSGLIENFPYHIYPQSEWRSFTNNNYRYYRIEFLSNINNNPSYPVRIAEVMFGYTKREGIDIDESINEGMILSNNGIFNFDYDIHKNTRPIQWDIGASEYVPLEIITQPETPEPKYLTQGQTFTCVATSTFNPIVYQWYKSSTPEGTKTAIGSDSTSLVLTNLQSTDEAYYICKVTDDQGQTLWSDQVYLEVIVGDITFITHPQSQTKWVSQNVTFSVSVNVTSGFTPSYQWLYNGSNIPGETSSTLTLTNLELEEAGNYRCRVSIIGLSLLSNIAVLTVIYEPIVITLQPSDITKYITQSATFSIDHNPVSTYTPTYEWIFRYGDTLVVLPGEEEKNLTIDDITKYDEGYYSCVIRSPGSYNVHTNEALLTVNEINIIDQPIGQTKYVTQSVSLHVGVEAFPGITHDYQWYKDDEIIDSDAATLPTYIIPIADLNDTGEYYCIVSVNGTGHTESDHAILTIIEEPIIIVTQPQSAITFENESHIFTVEIVPPETFTETYQWYFDGSIIPGETNNTIELLNISLENQGLYYCRITSPYEYLNSNIAELKVISIFTNLSENTLYTVSPYANYASNTVNRLNRTSTYGEDCILPGINSFNISMSSGTTNLYLSAGKCVIDDVLIETTDNMDENSLLLIDLLDYDNFVIYQDITAETGYYYVCLYYKYLKTRTTPEARIKIFHPSITNTFVHNNNYLLLKVVNIQNVGGNNVPIEVLDYDPSNFSICRKYKKNYMEFYGTLPEFNEEFTGRLIVVRQSGLLTLYLGGETDWIAIGGETSEIPVQIVEFPINPNNTHDEYDVGTFWLNTESKNVYICVNNTKDNAIWKLWITELGSYPDLVIMNDDPLPSDNTYDIGTLWINQVLDKAFVLIGMAGSNSIWIEFTQGDSIIPPNLKKYFLL